LRRTATLRREIRVERVDAEGRVVDSQTQWEEAPVEPEPEEGIPVTVTVPGQDLDLGLVSGPGGRVCIDLAPLAHATAGGLTLRLSWYYFLADAHRTGKRDLRIEAEILEKVREKFPSGPLPSVRPDPKQLLQEARTLRSQNRLDEAEAKCREYCGLVPTDRTGWETLAQILSQTRRYREAAELCRDAASRVEPDPSSCLVSAGRYYESAREIDLARSMYVMAYERAPDYNRVSALYNFELRYGRDLTETRRRIEDVLAVSDPPFRGLLSHYAVRCVYEMQGSERCLETAGRLRRDLEDYRDRQNFERDLFRMMCDLVFPARILEAQAPRVFELAEDHVAAHALSALRANLRSFPESYGAVVGKEARLFYGALEEKERKGYRVLDYAEILSWCGESEEAEILLCGVAKTETNRHLEQRALRLLIGLTLDDGRKKQARSILKEYEDADAGNAFTLRQIARLLAGRFGDGKAALTYFERAYRLQKPPQNAYLGFDYARALRKAGRAGEAMKIAQTCMKNMIGTNGVRYMASYLEDEEGGRKKALELVEKRLGTTDDPGERVELLLLKADLFLYRERPRPAEALKALDQAEKAAGRNRFSNYEMERIWSARCLVANNHLKDRAMQEKYNNMLLTLRPRHENYLLWRAIALARWGEDKEEAWRAFRRIPPRRTLAYNRACFYSNVGELDKALALLRTAIGDIDDPEARDRQRLWAASDDEFRALRRRPAFQELVKPEKGR